MNSMTHRGCYFTYLTITAWLSSHPCTFLLAIVCVNAGKTFWLVQNEKLDFKCIKTSNWSHQVIIENHLYDSDSLLKTQYNCIFIYSKNEYENEHSSHKDIPEFWVALLWKQILMSGASWVKLKCVCILTENKLEITFLEGGVKLSANEMSAPEFPISSWNSFIRPQSAWWLCLNLPYRLKWHEIWTLSGHFIGYTCTIEHNGLA